MRIILGSYKLFNDVFIVINKNGKEEKGMS